MKVREFIREAEAFGWIELPRTGTSHRKYRHPNFKDPLIISGNPGAEMPKKTLHKLRKQAGMK